MYKKDPVFEEQFNRVVSTIDEDGFGDLTRGPLQELIWLHKTGVKVLLSKIDKQEELIQDLRTALARESK